MTPKLKGDDGLVSTQRFAVTALIGALAALAGCGGGGGSGSFPSDPLGAMTSCLDDANVKASANEAGAGNAKTLDQVGTVKVPIPSDIIFVEIFKTPKAAAYYAKGTKTNHLAGHAVVTYNSYSSKRPEVAKVNDCVDSTGVGASS